MKKTLLITLFFLSLLPAGAQGYGPAFDGVSLRGDAMAVSGAFRTRGWTLVEAADHVVVLRGSWKEFRDVALTILEDDAGRRVTCVTVLVPVAGDWALMTQAWEDVVAADAKAWGPPERVRTRLLVAGAVADEEKPLLVQSGRCEWAAEWNIPGGGAVTALTFLPFSYYVSTKITLLQ